mmetsp:Transcript_888/g.2703  ORF Transcript_888/g.2703 Transcript_888/m.2703 type:complete len:256 (+) Transcript_888:182-949(+)
MQRESTTVALPSPRCRLPGHRPSPHRRAEALVPLGRGDALVEQVRLGAREAVHQPGVPLPQLGARRAAALHVRRALHAADMHDDEPARQAELAHRRLRRRRLRARAVEDGRPAEAAAVARRVAVQEGAVGGRQLEGRVVLLRVERDDAVDAEPREESHRPLCLPQVAELDEQRHTPPAAPRRGVALGDDRLEALPQLCRRVAAVAAAVVHVRARLVDLDEVGQRQAEAHAAQHPLQLVGGIAVRWMTHDRHSDRE